MFLEGLFLLLSSEDREISGEETAENSHRNSLDGSLFGLLSLEP